MAITGTWISRGYGWILQIDPDGYALHDYTALSCVEFERGDKSQFEAAFDRLSLTSRDQLSLHVRGEISQYDFDRLENLPLDCQALDSGFAANPERIFDVFCEYFRQDYIFFELRNVDWESKCRRARSLVNPTMESDQLFNVLAGLIHDLKDNHVILKDGDKLATSESIAELKKLMIRQFGLDFPSIGHTKTIATIQPYIRREFLNGKGASAGNGAISWGILDSGIGYLNVLKLFGLAETDQARNANDLPPNRYDHAGLLEHDLDAMEGILDHVMTDLGNCASLILDIRINGGGFDRLGISIANRFCERRCLAFSKEARYGDELTPKQEFYLEPQCRPSFSGSVYLLTSARTASAGEVLGLCMRALPNVTIVGQRTIGILSDNLAKHLPNGWITSLSNEIYRAPDGSVFESCGIPVDVEVPVFDAANFSGGLRRAIDTSAELALAENV